MPLPANKATTAYKTMDIKTALLSGVNRKRKSVSQIAKDEPKSKKPSVENGDQEKIEILDEACGITVMLQADEIGSTLGDCKENKDINSTKLECAQENSKDKHLNTSKVEQANTVEKISNSILKIESPNNRKTASANEIELLSDKSKNSGESSCDELNNSINVSLNTSELSVTAEENEKEHQTEPKPKDESQNKNGGKNQTDSKERVKKKKMTPAEAKKRTEKREQIQNEKLLKKQELENKKKERQLEKEQKLKEKLLKKEREEIERKERERIKQEKKEQEEKERLKKQKEKEEKAKMKQMQLEQEKKKKEEMRLKKEEELKKAEEEKRAKLEKEQKEKEKQERAKAAFAKFFLKAENNATAPSAQTSEKRAFLPFQVSDDMTLAPVVPPVAQERFDKKQLDHCLKFQDEKKLYLDILNSGTYESVQHKKKDKKLADSEIIIIDQNAETELGLHPKLLQFHENVRPPYWGTWRKKSKNIRPKNPFGQDEMFDYDVDSDDEWDEGGPGESLSGTENEDESEDDYEVDNEFFVPHGYLSDEEEKKEDDDEEVNDPEKQKALLKLKLQEFEMERKKKTTELKPIILGCYFANDPAFQDPGLQMFLQTYIAEILTETPIPTSFTIKSQQSGSSNNTAESPKSSNNISSNKKPVPEKAFPQLIRLVHGNVKNRRTLAEEFQRFWSENSEVKQQDIKPSSNPASCKESTDEVPSDFSQISLRQIIQTIREIASYVKCPDSTFNKYCWWVHDNIREKYGLLDAPIPNQWKYVSKKIPERATKNNFASKKDTLSSN